MRRILSSRASADSIPVGLESDPYVPPRPIDSAIDLTPLERTAVRARDSSGGTSGRQRSPSTLPQIQTVRCEPGRVGGAERSAIHDRTGFPIMLRIETDTRASCVHSTPTLEVPDDTSPTRFWGRSIPARTCEPIHPLLPRPPHRFLVTVRVRPRHRHKYLRRTARCIPTKAQFARRNRRTPCPQPYAPTKSIPQGPLGPQPRHRRSAERPCLPTNPGEKWIGSVQGTMRSRSHETIGITTRRHDPVRADETVATQ